jgi:predicted GTPase
LEEKKWMVVVTKCDGDSVLADVMQQVDEVWRYVKQLGCAEVVAVSAKEGMGLRRLVTSMRESMGMVSG